MKKQHKLFINLLLLTGLFTCTQIVTAQNENYGTWTGFSIEKNHKKWGFSAETELRTIYYVRLIDRWSLSLNADYDLMKNLKLSAGYEFMNKLDTKYLNYQFRNRLNAAATGKLKFNDFSFSLREKFQVTQKDESKRIRTDGSIDHYNPNPEWSWRNRAKVSYNIPHNKITPSFSFETFYDLNNPDGNQIYNLRYTLNFKYKVAKHNYIELYGVVNSSQYSGDATGKYILGVSYTYVIK